MEELNLDPTPYEPSVHLFVSVMDNIIWNLSPWDSDVTQNIIRSFDQILYICPVTPMTRMSFDQIEYTNHHDHNDQTKSMISDIIDSPVRK